MIDSEAVALIEKLTYPSASRLADPAVLELLEPRGAARAAGFPAHPPAFIPLVEKPAAPATGLDAEVLGLWKPWFVPQRATFVALRPGDSSSPLEVSRTEDQLIVRTLVRSIAADAGDASWPAVADDLVAAARMLGVGPVTLGRIAAHVRAHGPGDDLLHHLKEFRTATPLQAITQGVDYDGDFSAGAATASPQGDDTLAAAWLALNRTGWTLGEAAEALANLRRASPDPRFDEQISGWLARASAASWDQY